MKFFTKVVQAVKIGPELFGEISNRDDIKFILKRAMHASKPVHVLLVGTPGTGKTAFLDSIYKYAGKRAVLLQGKNMSKAGTLAELVEKMPRYTLIDEIEEASKDIQSGLLDLMQNGRLKNTLIKQKIDVQLNTWVIGTCNHIDKLSPQFLDRMLVINVKSYTEEQYIEVARAALAKDHVSAELAEYIASTVLAQNGKMNLREVVRVGSMAKTKEDVDELLQILGSVS